MTFSEVNNSSFSGTSPHDDRDGRVVSLAGGGGIGGGGSSASGHTSATKQQKSQKHRQKPDFRPGENIFYENDTDVNDVSGETSSEKKQSCSSVLVLISWVPTIGFAAYILKTTPWQDMTSANQGMLYVAACLALFISLAVTVSLCRDSSNSLQADSPSPCNE